MFMKMLIPHPENLLFQNNFILPNEVEYVQSKGASVENNWCHDKHDTHWLISFIIDFDPFLTPKVEYID